MHVDVEDTKRTGFTIKQLKKMIMPPLKHAILEIFKTRRIKICLKNI